MAKGCEATMIIRSRKRIRNEIEDSDARCPSSPRNPWDEEAARHNLRDLGDTIHIDDEGKVAQYNEWAERLRQKRQRTREEIEGSTPKQEASYWTTDALFEESRRIQENELSSRPDPARVQELLSELDLRGNATAEEIGSAYRRLAKQHHPDRYAAADEATQRFHAERMAAINRAYRALKDLQLA
ncbi:MAG: J domain-containing protein [Acidimicrobiales bacterium]|nr:J domain-containing protein [Acidimicrobiales bacterium]